jgi:hypothetical protein
MKELEVFCSEMTKLKLCLNSLYKEAFNQDWRLDQKVGSINLWFNDFVGVLKIKKLQWLCSICI